MFYSKMTGSFFDLSVHGNSIPNDAVEITAERHSELMTEQASGRKIIAGKDGLPVSVMPSSPTRTKTSLLAAVSDKRWKVETSGIVVAGSPIKTDRESQAQLSNAFTSLKNELIPDTPWKAADGTFVRVTLAQIEPIAKAVAAHVRICFAAEEAHHQAIASLQTQAELDAYDINTGWPK